MKTMRKYAVIIRISFSNAIAYRAQILSGFCFYTVFIYVFICLWRAIYSEGGVEGYSYVQIVWYLIMTELTAFALRTSIYREISDEVKSGSIAYLLGRPVHYVFYQLANSIGQAVLNLISFGVLAAVLGLAFVGPLPGFRPLNLIPLFVSICLSLLLNFFFYMLIGLSAFVMEDNFALFLIFQKIVFMLGLFLPIELLPAGMQTVAKLLPFSYVAWAPAKLFVDFSWPLFFQLVPRQAMWTVVMATLTLVVYNACTRRLEVNGG